MHSATSQLIAMNSFYATHKLISAYRSGRPLALLMDYEGTLAPIDSASGGVLGWSTRSLLARLAHLPRTITGVIGECSVDRLKQAVRVEDIYYGGCRGLEVDLKDGNLWLSEEYALLAELPRLRAFVEELLGRFAGVLVRQHQRGLIVDYRSLGEPDAAIVKAEILRVLLTCRPELELYEGTHCIEIVIASASSKANAVRLMLERSSLSAAFVMYAGNDRGDAEVFDAVNTNGGISLGVGANAPANARFRLRDTAALNVVLGCLLSAIAPQH